MVYVPDVYSAWMGLVLKKMYSITEIPLVMNGASKLINTKCGIKLSYGLTSYYGCRCIKTNH
jgi:hypothetical protein